MVILAITKLAKPFYFLILKYALTLDHRSVPPNHREARASFHRNSRHRRSRQETSFWLPAPSKSAVHVTLTRPLKRGATINGPGVYHSSRLSWGALFRQLSPKVPSKLPGKSEHGVSNIANTERPSARGKLPNSEVVRFRRYTFRPNCGLPVDLRRLDTRIIVFPNLVFQCERWHARARLRCF